MLYFLQLKISSYQRKIGSLNKYLKKSKAINVNILFAFICLRSLERQNSYKVCARFYLDTDTLLTYHTFTKQSIINFNNMISGKNMICTLCHQEIHEYHPELHQLVIDETHTAHVCSDCITKFFKWQQKLYAKLFPTTAMKKMFGQDIPQDKKEYHKKRIS